MREVDAAARRVIRDAGYAEYAIRGTGRGFGIEAHEFPYVRWDVENPMEEGMALSIEPGIYVPGVRRARDSDTVVVNRDGRETITDALRGADNLTLGRQEHGD